MSKLFVYASDSVSVLELNGNLMYQNFQMVEIENGCQIISENESCILQDGQSNQIETFRFLYSKKEENWYCHKMEETFTIGRNSRNNIILQSPLVSSFHARFIKKGNQYWMEDLCSSNGTYHNGKRVKEEKCKNLDVFLIANVQILFLDSYLFIDEKCDGFIPSIPPGIRKKISYEIYKETVPEWHLKPISLESPMIQESPKKTRLFQALGPSFMILAGSITSYGIEWALNPETSFTIERILSPICMSLAFLGYGLINRNLSFKDSKESIHQKEELYNLYLEQKEKELETLYHDYHHFILKQRDYFLSCHEPKQEPFQLYLTQNKTILEPFTYSQMSYQHQNHTLVQKRNRLIQKGNTPQVSNQFYFQKQKVWIHQPGSEKEIETLIFQIIQTQSPLKVCVCHHAISYDSLIFGLECCQIDFHPLYLQDEDSFLLLKQMKQDYLLLTDSIELVKRMNPENCILWSTQPFSFPNFVSVDHIDVSSMDVHSLLRTFQKNTRKEQIEMYFPFLKDSQVHLESIVGLDENQQPILLDFNEGKDGPHALVAGMTGSGKSEFLSTLLMGWIVRNDPKFFQYILIDFKGGAFGQAFYEFSHCAGMVTNLEEENISRLMDSLSNEIQNRQRKLKVGREKYPDMKSHIDSYNQYMEDVISHLFIIVDEFAQMKMKYPEYLDHLKEYSRIGRSLGIHLILATQKPMGVVDEQIWSNSTSKICLKVNSPMDSKEMLHHEKGYELKNTGDFIAQNLEEEKEGHSFYLSQIVPEKGNWKEIDSHQNILFQKQKEDQSLFQKLSQKIDCFHQNWILLPPLSKSMPFFQNQWAWMDLPKEQRQEALYLNYGQSLVVLCQDYEKEKEFLAFCLKQFKNDVRTYGCQKYGNFPLLDVKKDAKEEHTWILDSEEVQWISSYLNQSNCRIILFVHSITTKIHSMLAAFTYKLCLQYDDTDSVRSFFDQYQVGNMPKVKVNSYYASIVFPTVTLPVFKKGTKSKNQTYLGMDMDKQLPVYYEYHRPLLICTVQKSKEKEIDSLVSELLEKTPELEFNRNLIVLNLLKQQSFFSNPEYLEIQYDCNILWIGQGIHEYGYLLKRQIPFERNMDRVYFDEKEVKRLQYASHSDFCEGTL